jgi:phosphoribosyl 1,2-cyclic phosphodiesterase
VPIHFQSLRSSSAGNCLTLWTSTSSILIDCGFRVQRDCIETLGEHLRLARGLDGVIVTHAHGDHMSYGALRVLGREGIPLFADGRTLRQLRDWHDPAGWKQPPEMHAFRAPSFDLGDFHVRPIEVPHAPAIPTFGFVITARSRGTRRSIVVCTDLHDYAAVLPHLADADFIFVEANHDLELLRRHPNPASRYHLNNVQTASLLGRAVAGSAKAPRAVMLGHLSEERNRRALATNEVTRMFARQQVTMNFHLDAAPARRPSEVVEI